MRKSILIVFSLLLIPGLAFAQGAGGTGKKKSKARELLDAATAGPGHIQEEFFKDLGSNFEQGLGKQRGQEMMEHLKSQDIKKGDSLDLMNGACTNSELQDYFGSSRGELEKTRKALDESVDEKNKDIFFGIIFVVMVKDFDVDPSSEFCKQACGAKDEISDESMEKMLKGNRSKRTLKEAFGFDDKEDLSFLQDILNRAWESGMGNHPMAASMGMGNPKNFKKSDFPEFGKGMTGYGENQDGMAGGMPCATDMPPVPFFGDNMNPFFGGEGTKKSK